MKRYKFPVFFLLLVTALLVLSACSGGGAATPPTKPTVQILAPAYGASVTEGDTVGVQVAAADSGGVMRIEMQVDGNLAGSKLSPNVQGDALFAVTLPWVAAKPGAHTIVVRAFNAAGAAGEASIPLAVTPSAGAPTTIAQQNTLPAPSPTQPPPDVPSVTPLPVTNAPNPTDAPPTETRLPDVTPTDLPPTPAPTATLPPIAYQLPFDGGMNVELSWSENGLYIGANANDSLVGGDNGDGIAYVEFFVQDLEGNVIATKRENNKPYCFFGEADGNCLFIQPGTNQFVWRSGVPITEGWYLIRAVGHSLKNTIQVAERPLRLNLPPDSFEDIFVSIVEPFTDRIENELVFEADVSGAGTGSGVERVEMQIVQYDGKIVHERTERTARYCGFGGGENNQPCPPYGFAANGSKWSSGAPIYPTQYVLRAIVYLNDGNIAATTAIMQIDRVK